MQQSLEHQMIRDLANTIARLTIENSELRVKLAQSVATNMALEKQLPQKEGKENGNTGKNKADSKRLPKSIK